MTLITSEQGYGGGGVTGGGSQDFTRASCDRPCFFAILSLSRCSNFAKRIRDGIVSYVRCAEKNVLKKTRTHARSLGTESLVVRVSGE